jgi:ATP-dependent DNA ligase
MTGCELKLDGFRIGVEIDRGKVRLLAGAKEWTDNFRRSSRGEAAARQDRADRR